MLSVIILYFSKTKKCHLGPKGTSNVESCRACRKKRPKGATTPPPHTRPGQRGRRDGVRSAKRLTSLSTGLFRCYLASDALWWGTFAASMGNRSRSGAWRRGNQREEPPRKAWCAGGLLWASARGARSKGHFGHRSSARCFK